MPTTTDDDLALRFVAGRATAYHDAAERARTIAAGLIEPAAMLRLADMLEEFARENDAAFAAIRGVHRGE